MIHLPCRLPVWIALVLFSLVSLLSILDESNAKTRTFEVKWCIALSSISLGLAFLATLANMSEGMRDKFLTTKVEGFTIIISVTVWILAIPVAMAPNHGLAMSQSIIVDANLYFASWLAFCCSLAMLGSFGGRLGDDSAMGYMTKYWLCLFLASMITMAAALRLFRDNEACSTIETKQCDNLRMGIALSIVSAVVTGIILIFAFFLKTKTLSSAILLVASILVLAIWSVLVTFLTFKNGPGSRVGTLFFGTWISCILSLYLAVLNIYMMSASSGGSSSVPSSSQKKRSNPEPVGRAYEEQSKV